MAGCSRHETGVPPRGGLSSSPSGSWRFSWSDARAECARPAGRRSSLVWSPAARRATRCRKTRRNPPTGQAWGSRTGASLGVSVQVDECPRCRGHRLDGPGPQEAQPPPSCSCRRWRAPRAYQLTPLTEHLDSSRRKGARPDPSRPTRLRADAPRVAAAAVSPLGPSAPRINPYSSSLMPSSSPDIHLRIRRTSRVRRRTMFVLASTLMSFFAGLVPYPA